jgi:hypothetical protein
MTSCCDRNCLPPWAEKRFANIIGDDSATDHVHHRQERLLPGSEMECSWLRISFRLVLDEFREETRSEVGSAAMTTRAEIEEHASRRGSWLEIAHCPA